MEATTLRPQTWDAFIGQPKMKKRLETHIDAANERDDQLEHVLLLGPAGSGKTSLAELIAEKHDSLFTSIIMGQMKLPMLQDVIINTSGVLFLDEVHKLKPAEQEMLLPVLLDGYVQMPYGREYLRYPLTIIAATTEREKVLRTIRERFKIRPEFEPYTDEDMTKILWNMNVRSGCGLSEETVATLAKATAGQPRQAETIIFCARDVGGDDPFDILEFAGITPDGLTSLHVRYLAALRKNNGGVAGVDVLSSSLSLDKPSVIELERLLASKDMIEYTPKGRSLKALGARSLEQHKEML